jgi:hypothetical protein
MRFSRNRAKLSGVCVSIASARNGLAISRRRPRSLIAAPAQPRIQAVDHPPGLGKNPS